MQRLGKGGMGKSASSGALPKAMGGSGVRPGAGGLNRNQSAAQLGTRPGKGYGKGAPPAGVAAAPDSPTSPADDDIWAPVVVEKPKTREPPVGEASRLARKYHLDLYEVKYILRLFIEADDNGSGGLDKEEFAGVLRKLFEIPKSQQVPNNMLKDAWENLMMDRGDGRGQSEASTDNFLAWYTNNMFTPMVCEVNRDDGEEITYELAKKHKLAVPQIDKIKKRFDQFDTDGSGKIDFPEYFQMLKYVLKCKRDEDLSTERAQKFWAEIDIDGSGEIEFPEFVEWFVKYFNPDEEDMDMTRGPVSQFYASYNSMAKYTNGPNLDAYKA